MLAIVIVCFLVAALFARRATTHTTARALRAAPYLENVAAVPDVGSIATYDETVRELLRRKTHAETMALLDERVGSRWAQLANYQMTFARLTGDYDSYVAAEESLDKSFRLARAYVNDAAVGPMMMKAQLSFELHRLRIALVALEGPERQAAFFNDRALKAETTSLRGAITFSLGEYERGIALLREAVRLAGSESHKQRLALSLDKVGETAEANHLFDEAEKNVESPRARAWIAMQRGRMNAERGKREQARSDFERARASFPGFWLVDEQLAELDAEEGESDRAIASYRSLVERTGDPEFMDALGRLLLQRDPAESRRLLARSRAIYDERLRKLPEATYGHALEHFLTMESDAERALEIAKKNFELRPDGEARTRLAQAYLKSGRTREACAEIQKVLDSRWRSAASYGTAALALRRIRDEKAAATAEATARAMNPHVMEKLDWLAAP